VSRIRTRSRTMAALAVLALVATACGGDDDGAADTTAAEATDVVESATTTGAATTAQSETSVAGETATTAAAADDADLDLDATIRITTAAPGVSLDPHRERQFGDRDYTNLLYDRLTVIKTDQSVAPMLAESWEFAPDGSELTLTLRDDATFQDGTRIDAAAVKANLERAKALPDGTVAAFLANVSSIEAVDDTTVVLAITEGGADLPAILATNVGMIVNPKAFTDGRDLVLSPGDAGSGPYQVVEYVPNERAVFERVDGHWDPDAGKVKRIEMGFIPRGSSRVDGLRAGQLDLIQVTGVDQQVGLPLVESGEFGGFQVTVSTGHQLMFNVAMGELGTPEFRQAIGHAIDKQAIADQFLEGNCIVTTTLLPHGHWAAPEGEEPYPYDPDAAQALLSEAGLSNPSIEIATAAGSSAEPIAQVVQSNLQAIGVNATLKPLTQVEVDSGFRAGDLMSYQGFMTGQADPALLLNNFYFADSGFKLGGEEAVTKYRERANEANDPTLTQDERAELYKTLFADIQAEEWSVPICHTKQLWMHTTKVGNVSEDTPFIPVGLGDFRYVTVSK
jgi:peptide/nickel transport system substrate-binding protein